ncbi:MAG: hypothetical protein AAF597_17395, partial [Bacteroidota bacterium]
MFSFFKSSDSSKKNQNFLAFQAAVSWFNYEKAPVGVAKLNEFKLTQDFQELYPVMTELIS